MILLGNFQTGSKPSTRSIAAAKKIRKGEKGNRKTKTPKDAGHFLVQNCHTLISVHVKEHDASGKKACCHVANVFLRGLEVIWRILLLLLL